MQNKGFVKVFAVLLTLVCVFYLSFSFVTRHYTNKAANIVFFSHSCVISPQIFDV